MPLEPDRDQIEIFADAMFRHAAPAGIVSVRAFYEDDSSKPFRITPAALCGGLKFLMDIAEDDARRAANDPKKVVFCPPLATFSNTKHAREQDIAEGLVLSVECDKDPAAAAAKLKRLLGAPTAVIKSGGTWIDPENGEIQDKRHLHWRLRTPARGTADLAKLKQARDLAARLAGGDPSNKPVCHPIRWPGSYHRKGEPRLCAIETIDPDREIDLDAALTALTAAIPAEHRGNRSAGTFERETLTGDPAIDDLIRNGIAEPHRSENFARVVWSLAGSGMVVDKINSLLEQHPNGIAEKYTGRLLAEIVRCYSKWQRDGQNGPDQKDEAGDKPEIKLTYFDELTKATPKPWLIKNVIARGEASSWIAQPGKGKSALLTDIAVHGGGRQMWRGYRTKQKFATVYFALERADLVKRRLIAHRIRDTLPVLPIAICGQVLDLMDKGCVDLMVAAIKQTEEHFSCEAGLGIIDTYAKAIAAGGGDESSSRDQNVALANIRRVIDRMPHVHIAGIGHTGKDESKGERGSNARLADVDVLVHLKGDTIKTAVVTKANDQPLDILTSFRLEPFDFGLDEDGDPFRTYILSDEIFTATAADRALNDRQRLAMEALAEVVLAHGVNLTGNGLPKGLKSVTADQWLEQLYRKKVAA
jgi:AAA domain